MGISEDDEYMLKRKQKNEEFLNTVDELLYLISTIKKRKIAFFGHMIRRTNSHRLILEVPLAFTITRQAKNGVDDKYLRMDGNEIW